MSFSQAQGTYCPSPSGLQLIYAGAQHHCQVLHLPLTVLLCAVSGPQDKQKMDGNKSLHQTVTRCRHQLKQCRLLQGLQSRRQRLGGL